MGHKALAAAGPGWPYETWKPGAPCQGRLLENRVVLSKGNVLSVYSPMTGGQADLPDDFDTWVGKTINSPYGEKSITVYQNNIDETKRRIEDRAEFAQYAIDAVKCTHRVGHKF
jgi:hypothetical protein